MRTEARRSLRHGFYLTEPELRRIVDAIVQQFARVAGVTVPIIAFEVLFRNGAIARTADLDEVLALENYGSSRIARVEIDVRDVADEPPHQVVARFQDADEDESSWTAVKLLVRGDDRDWVFVTISQLEERVAKIKRWAPAQLTEQKAFFPAMMMMLLIVMFITQFWFVSRHSASIELEQRWRSGHLKDPVEAIVIAERSRAQEAGEKRPYFIPFFFILLASTLPMLISYLSPPYCFYWGDYTAIYDRRRTIRKYLLVVVATGIVASIIAGAIVNHFKIGLP